MSRIALRLGPLAGKGYSVQRSAIRWLCADGKHCRAGEVLGFCHIRLVSTHGVWLGETPFAEEDKDLCVAFAARVGGILRRSSRDAEGGWLDILTHHHWEPDFVAAHLEMDAAPDPETDPSLLALLMVTGRKKTQLTNDLPGLLAGWHGSSRAWWGDGDAFGTVLSIGTVCQLTGVFRGDTLAFTEFFEAVRGPAHTVFNASAPLVHCAAIAAEQIRRTPAEIEAISSDLVQAMAASSIVPNEDDWMFAGCLLSDLKSAPLTEGYDILTRDALRRVRAADAVIMTLSAESDVILRHKKLGYSFNCHSFRVAEAGPAIRAWLQSDFEPVKRTPDDIRRDFVALIDAVRARAPMQFLIVNNMATSGYEDVYCYSAFDQPMRETLSSVMASEMNLMLHDCARERDIAIVDFDAIAAEVGAAAHLSDQIHPSGVLQAELRREIARLLHARGVPGFAPSAFS